MATISDVAAHAGVGVGTVSRVLNNSPSVRPDTRARVLRAIDALEYRPNPLARALSRGRPQTIGVVIPFFTQPSPVERLRGVVAALQGSAYDLILFNVETPQQRDEHLRTLERRDRADGVLVISLPVSTPDLTQLTASGMPLVLVDARGDRVPMVLVDDLAGGRLATEHVLALGHHRVAFIGDDPGNPFGFPSSGEREAGYRDALAAAGIKPRRAWIRHCPHDRAKARRQADRLLALAEPPTAVFAASDVQALGVLDAARAHHVDVPGQLSVVGFDDIDIAAYAGITTVRQPLFESGRLGASLLLALLRGDTVDPTTHELPLELVERATTAPPAARRSRRRLQGVGHG